MNRESNLEEKEILLLLAYQGEYLVYSYIWTRKNGRILCIKHNVHFFICGCYSNYYIYDKIFNNALPQNASFVFSSSELSTFLFSSRGFSIQFLLLLHFLVHVNLFLKLYNTHWLLLRNSNHRILFSWSLFFWCLVSGVMRVGS